jgi:hypothetical protein
MKTFELFAFTLLGVSVSGYDDLKSDTMKRLVVNVQNAVAKSHQRGLFLDEIIKEVMPDLCSFFEGEMVEETNGIEDPSGMKCSCSGSTYECKSTKAYCDEYSNGEKICFTADGQTMKMRINLTGDSTIDTCTDLSDETTDSSLRGSNMCMTLVMGFDFSAITAPDSIGSGLSLIKSCAFKIDDSDCSCSLCENFEGFNLVCPGGKNVTCDIYDLDSKEKMDLMEGLKSLGPSYSSKLVINDRQVTKLEKSITTDAPTNSPTTAPTSGCISPVNLNNFILLGSILATIYQNN